MVNPSEIFLIVGLWIGTFLFAYRFRLKIPMEYVILGVVSSMTSQIVFFILLGAEGINFMVAMAIMLAVYMGVVFTTGIQKFIKKKK